MLRKLIVFAVLATGFSASPVAAANPPTQPTRYYEVMVLGPKGWQSHGRYWIHADARREAVRLWHEGYRVEIREF